MNNNNYVCWDTETTGVNSATCQIVQIGAVVIDGRRLEIIPDSEFNILVKPLYGEEAAKAGLDELTDGAIRIHGKTHAILEKDGVSLESALTNFKAYVDSHAIKKGQWSRPISAGYNIINYDHPILRRDLQKCNLDWPFHPRDIVDVMQIMGLFFENDKNVSSLSADNLIRGKFRYNKGQAHDALGDVIMTAEVLIKSLRLIRKTVSNINFDGCFSE